jgi:hypothetical protein
MSIAAAMAKNLQTAGHSLFVCSDEYDRIWKMYPDKSVAGENSLDMCCLSRCVLDRLFCVVVCCALNRRCVFMHHLSA